MTIPNQPKTGCADPLKIHLQFRKISINALFDDKASYSEP